MKPTHWIFTDESYKNEKFRSICALSGSKETFSNLKEKINKTCKYESEHKFQKLRNKIMREDIKNIFSNILLPNVISNKIRIDVIIWDSDVYNKSFDVMHYQLLKHVLTERWAGNNFWDYFPDEEISMDWSNIKKILSCKNKKISDIDLFKTGKTINEEFKINDITPLDSKQYKLIQIADNYAGLGAFSYNYYNHFYDWQTNETKNKEPLLISTGSENNKKAKKYRHRFILQNYILNELKKINQNMSFDSKNGFHNFRPNFGFNFWLYKEETHRN